MEKVYRGIYVDVNKSVEINIIETDGKFDIKFITDPNKENEKGYRFYVENIKQITKCKYHTNENGKIDGIDVYVGNLCVSKISKDEMGNANISETGELLTATEVRLLSQGAKDMNAPENQNIPFKRVKTKTPKTDLHTHMSGALTNEDMMYIGKKYNCLIPISLLERAGVDVQKYQGVFDYQEVINPKTKQVKKLPRVHFNDLTPEDIIIYSKQLSIQTNAQETFITMDKCYDFRDPFVKLKPDFLDKNVDIVEVLKDQLRCLAKHYQKMGVEYVELSTADICKDPATFVQMLDKVMPEIEKEFPDVYFKFLGGIPRVISQSAMDTRNQNLISGAKSKYIVGLDVMAHEVNDTGHFKHIIEDCVEYAQQVGGNFVIRVHAGESAVNYDNIKQFLKIVKDSLKPGMAKPIIRIGHGVHGLDPETIALCKELDATIEINLSSNIAINNIDGPTENDIAKYIAAGVKVCLGTDGHGMYSTDAKQEAIVAAAAGVTPEQMDIIIQNEEKYISRMLALHDKKNEANNEEKLNYLMGISGRIKSVVESKKDANLTPQQLAIEVCKELNDPKNGKLIEITPDEMLHLLQNGILDLNENTSIEEKEKLISKMPTHYYRENFDIGIQKRKMLSRVMQFDDSSREIRDIFHKLKLEELAKEKKVNLEVDENKPLHVIAGKKPVFIMGYVDREWLKLSAEQKQKCIANAIGFIASLDPEKTYIVTTCDGNGFNKIVHDIIKKVNPTITVNGILTHDQIKDMTPEHKTWIFDNFDNVKVEKGHMFTPSSKIVNFLNEQDGEMVAFGEGSEYKDHITNMHNTGTGKLHLFDDGSGVSTKVKFLAGNGYEFSNYKQLSQRFAEKGLIQPQLDVSVKDVEKLIKYLVEEYVIEDESGKTRGISAFQQRDKTNDKEYRRDRAASFNKKLKYGDDLSAMLDVMNEIQQGKGKSGYISNDIVKGGRGK